MGVFVDMKTMTEDILSEAINEVLTNPTYKENAKATQTLVNDHMVEPKEEFLYWIKYIIRHKGAKHLIHSYAHDMPFIEFWSIDVFALLLLTFIAFCFLATTICYVMFNYFVHLVSVFRRKSKSD